MTTYSYTITLRDNEIIVLQAALEQIVKHSQEQLDLGEKAPYWAYKHHATEILKKLYDNVVQTSGNNFFDDD